MKPSFVPMNEEYRNDHYPDGSVFSAIHKSSKKGGIFIYIFFAPVLLVTAIGTVFSVIKMIQGVAAGDEEMIPVGLFAIGVCLTFFVLSLFSVLTTKKRGALGADGLIKKSAKSSACDENEIREFERQAMASDSYILALTAKYKAALNGQRDGILTRDYIFLGDNLNIVMRCSDIVAALLVQRVIYITVNNKTKRIDSLTISLVSNKNVQTFVDASVEAGSELLSILLEKNPQIETKGGSIMQEKEYDQYCKALAAARA